MAIHYNQRLDHFLPLSTALSGMVGFGVYLPAESFTISSSSPPSLPSSRDQVFRINVRNGDEIRKLTQLVNSDHFKVCGSSSPRMLSLRGNSPCTCLYPWEFSVHNGAFVNMPFTQARGPQEIRKACRACCCSLRWEAWASGFPLLVALAVSRTLSGTECWACLTRWHLWNGRCLSLGRTQGSPWLLTMVLKNMSSFRVLPELFFFVLFFNLIVFLFISAQCLEISLHFWSACGYPRPLCQPAASQILPEVPGLRLLSDNWRPTGG